MDDSEAVRACKSALNEAETEAYKEDVDPNIPRLLSKIREASLALAQLSETEQPMSKEDARDAVLDADGSVNWADFEALAEGMRERVHYLAPPSDEDIEFMKDALSDRR